MFANLLILIPGTFLSKFENMFTSTLLGLLFITAVYLKFANIKKRVYDIYGKSIYLFLLFSFLSILPFVKFLVIIFLIAKNGKNINTVGAMA